MVGLRRRKISILILRTQDNDPDRRFWGFILGDLKIEPRIIDKRYHWEKL